MVRFDIPIENKKFSEMNPVVCGFQECPPKHTGGITLRPYYLIHYVKKGRGYFETEGKRYSVKEGQIYILYKNQIGYYEADEKDPWTYYWIGFDGSFAGKIRQLDSQVLDFNSSLFEEMISSKNIKSTRSEFLVGKLFEMMSFLFEHDGKISYVKQVKDYIKSSYMLPLSVEHIAKMHNLNRRYLSRIFREETGLSIKQYITKIKMDRAQHLLEQGFSVGNVAEMVGYDDVFNFSKMYKKVKGFPPKVSKEKKLEFFLEK